jgi:cytochrome b6-f complex iron-sulfur subunit
MSDQQELNESSQRPPRRNFLVNAWRAGFALIAGAGAWTARDLLRPGKATGFGGVVKTVASDAVPSETVLPVPAAHGYLTSVDGAVTALHWKCPHLGCRVPWCESSGRFECPCHGSVFSRAGDYIAGPAPHGMDSFSTEVVNDTIMVDTGSITIGRAPGDVVLDEDPKGPSCVEGGA